MKEADRIDALEFKVSHLERALQELSDVLYRQQREIDGMLELNRQLTSQLEQMEARGADANSVEIPPHY